MLLLKISSLMAFCGADTGFGVRNGLLASAPLLGVPAAAVRLSKPCVGGPPGVAGLTAGDAAAADDLSSPADALGGDPPKSPGVVGVEVWCGGWLDRLRFSLCGERRPRPVGVYKNVVCEFER